MLRRGTYEPHEMNQSKILKLFVLLEVLDKVKIGSGNDILKNHGQANSPFSISLSVSLGFIKRTEIFSFSLLITK